MEAIEQNSLVDEPKRAYRLVEPVFADLRGENLMSLLRAALLRTLERFGEECGLTSATLPRKDGPAWVAVPQRPGAPVTEGLSRSGWEALRRDRLLFTTEPPPLVLWLLGSHSEWLAAFELSRPATESSALLLQVARLAIQQLVLGVEWSTVLDRARAIQRSLLPDPLPDLPGFDLAARSDSAEPVGGDVYDAMRLAPNDLGIMIADASGHGLPAALEARDVVIGLRMGAAVERNLEVTIERLNQILCGSTLSSRFTSLVYGELHSNGAFEYVNAGHPAPVLIVRGGAHPLPGSGRVLGVSTRSAYGIHHAIVPPEGALILYTDGVTECPSPSGEEFGIGRLTGVASKLARERAGRIVTAVFEALVQHSRGSSPPDDASILVARRL